MLAIDSAQRNQSHACWEVKAVTNAYATIRKLLTHDLVVRKERAPVHQ
jgi:hypothetical protein